MEGSAEPERGLSTSFLALSGQRHTSARLEEFALYVSTRASYETAVKVVEQASGERLLCRQTLTDWAERGAAYWDAVQREEVEQARQLPDIQVASAEQMQAADLYDPQAKEVLVLADSVGVSAQKPTHEREGEPKKGKPLHHHELDLMRLQKPDGTFVTCCESSDRKVSVVEACAAALRALWQPQAGAWYAERALPMVALTDGATRLRVHLAGVFGCTVRIILDWYHLRKRVRDKLSMLAHTRPQREAWERAMLTRLWYGDTPQAVAFVQSLQVRHPEQRDELVGYLQRHQAEIIDYDRRQRAGKPIGSGQMEKTVDVAVASRQKKKGMSWSPRGSRALAVLRVAQMNGRWFERWPALHA